MNYKMDGKMICCPLRPPNDIYYFFPWAVALSFDLYLSLMGIPSWEQSCFGNSPQVGHVFPWKLQFLNVIMPIKMLFIHYKTIYHQHLNLPFSEYFKNAMSKSSISTKNLGGFLWCSSLQRWPHTLSVKDTVFRHF